MTTPEAADALRAAQAELERQNRLYAMLSHINRAIVRAEIPQELYASASRIAVDQGSFRLAWVGLVEPASGRVETVASAGCASIADFRLIADNTSQPGPTGHVVREGLPLIANDTAAHPAVQRWHEALACWDIRALASFPLKHAGRIVGAFNVAASETGFFKDAEIRLLDEVAGDLSYALDVMGREELRIAAESKMKYLAYYDPQTGIPSRALFEERLGSACRDGRPVAVLVATLRRYHTLVQLLGPVAGADMVRQLAARLETAMPSTTLARLAEAEFAFLLEEADGLHEVEETAWSIHHLLAQCVRVAQQEVFLDPFVGIAVFPQDGEAPDVLRHAIMAATARQQNGNDFCRFFSPDMEGGSRHRLSLDAALRRALEREEFVLHYQPQVDLASGRMVGAEALLRWERPSHGLVPPHEFVPVLEDNRLIGAVGEWVLHEACRSARRWQDQGLPPFRMAVNLSARQFQEGNIKLIVRGALESTGLAPECLELELTEGIVLLDAEGVIRTMHELNADGISHALDDFGTGYSSLSYLQRLPVARLKIDRSFVTHITSNPSDATITRAMVGMAHNLGLTVIAEGVETEGQLGYLRGLGCEEMQGYYFSRPLPEAQFGELLREGRHIPPGGSTPRPERVLLLVDDEASILTSLNRALRRHGYRVLNATRASEGFDLMASHPVGVVVCDQRMPEMTGTEFLRRIKELHPNTVRIVLSGYTELNSVIDAVNRGAVYKFLTKPWDQDVLLESLDDAFRLYELGCQNREMSRMLRERLQSPGAANGATQPS